MANGGPYEVSSKSMDNGACSTDYDPEIVTADYLMGINYPASMQVAKDLQSTDNRPARRRQFKQLLAGVTDVSSADRLQGRLRQHGALVHGPRR
jgi:hypothetical protein